MFLPKNAAGEFPLDPNEPPFAAWELERAEKYLQTWEGAIRQRGQPPAGPCPHEDYPCENRGECVEKIAWWRRYISEIEDR